MAPIMHSIFGGVMYLCEDSDLEFFNGSRPTREEIEAENKLKIKDIEKPKPVFVLKILVENITRPFYIRR
jgi:hypothetical protein